MAIISGLSSINSLQNLSQANTANAVSSTSSTSFSNMLNEAMTTISSTESAAANESMALLTGDSANIHNVVLAAEKAEVALQLTLQIRNKVLDAYSEIMRMQI